MIDPKDDSTGFLLAHYVQRHERTLALLELLAAELTPEAQDRFMALIGEQERAEAQTRLEAAAMEAQAAGLDTVDIVTKAMVVTEPLEWQDRPPGI